MPEVRTDKLDQLFRLLEREPNDTFLLYGIGMEYKKLSSPEKAIQYFDKVIAEDPAYCYAYYQRGQVFEQLGQTEQARESYKQGIEAAGRAGDAHARSELQAALDLIE